MQDKNADATPEKLPDGEPAYRTAADIHNIGNDSPPPTPGLSIAPGLRAIPDSQAPSMADGSMVSHVMGPGQAAVDPVAAGLDTRHHPLTRAENRVITRTGEIGAGPRPATYADKGVPVKQSTDADGGQEAAPSEAQAEKAPGPNAGNAKGKQ